MKCPYCTTENREDRETCYHCGKDIAMLRLIVNKARHHYNVALEHAERQRYPQALAELEHCLELDHSFVPAHVVMGTVYAKMEKLDAAECCWQVALALDPHILKAHEYLGKSALAKKAVPLVRRLRWAIGLALGIAGVFALALLWHLRPTADETTVQRVRKEIEEGNYGTALELAEQLQDTARSPDVRDAARLLELTVEQRYESALMEMLIFLLGNRPIETHQLYQRLVQQFTPPERYRRQLDALDQRAAEQAIALLNSWRRQFDEGTLSYDDLAKKADGLRRTFVQRDEIAQQTAKTLASARKAFVARTLTEIPTSPLSTTDTLKWLALVRELSNRVPEGRDVLTSTSKRLVADCLAQMEPKAAAILAGKDPAPIRATLVTLQEIAAYERSETTDQLIEKARASLKRMETDRFKTRLSSATVADIPPLDAWVASYEKDTSVTVANDAEVSGVLARARRRLAGEMVTWCTERVWRFQKKKMSNEEAKFLTDRAEFAGKYSAAKSWRNTLDCLTFCTAIAWLQLGNTEQALRWFDRLEKSYPESSYLPTARRYRQQTEEDLKIPVQLPE